MPNNFTPGPWVHEGQGDITGIENDPKNGCVGKVDIAAVYLRTVPGRSDANAALIASAPDLLAECDRLKTRNAELAAALEAVTDEATEIAELLALMGRLPASTGRDNAAIVGARAAIAKHKGETA